MSCLSGISAYCSRWCCGSENPDSFDAIDQETTEELEQDPNFTFLQGSPRAEGSEKS